jgi:hypothetical protein
MGFVTQFRNADCKIVSLVKSTPLSFRVLYVFFHVFTYVKYICLCVSQTETNFNMKLARGLDRLDFNIIFII